jgi:hypothetical protein
MTFILNILHKDFSLLACDKQGNASGTAVFQSVGGAPKITVTSPKITVDGVNKLFTNSPRTLAVGVAGTIQDHAYTSKLKDTEDVVGALDMIHAHISTYFVHGDRRDVIQAKPVMQNQGLATFFDVAAKEFFTDMFLFTPNDVHSRVFHAPSNAPRLLHVGSRSSVQHQRISRDTQRITLTCNVSKVDHSRIQEGQ